MPDAAPLVSSSSTTTAPGESLDSLFRSVALRRAFRLYNRIDDGGAAADVACMVLDVRMPGVSGLDFLDPIEGERPCAAHRVHDGHGDIPMSVRP